MRNDETVCPFCKGHFPLNKSLCPTTNCFAYRVDDENYDLPFYKRHNIKEEVKRKVKILKEIENGRPVFTTKIQTTLSSE